MYMLFFFFPCLLVWLLFIKSISDTVGSKWTLIIIYGSEHGSANRGDSLDRNIDEENRMTKDFLILVSNIQPYYI